MSSHAKKTGSAGLAITALGVVFGDIGTSPLYAMRETFDHSGLEINESNVLGVLSLVVWSLVIVIVIKYIMFIMRADLNGEGGELALAGLLGDPKKYGRFGKLLLGLGIFGTALIYGDGMITPAISVLSAVEGATVVSPNLEKAVIPVAVFILIALFSVQSKGTAKIGNVFGPIMIIWFATLGTLGVLQISKNPGILKAFSPTYAVQFFIDNTTIGFLALGSIFLVVTGGEALYADLGHFGRKPIAQSWFIFVLPGLILNYFGQGALLIDDPETIENPFYLLTPDWALYPMLILATSATIIASQALISGAFSLTLQAVRMQYLPRLRIIHTSENEQGQIYVPAVNWALMVASVALVIGFHTSSNLAAAYGIAVAISMVISTTLFFVVSQGHLKFSLKKALIVCVPLIIVDLSFFGANLPKVPQGGWFPLIIGGLLVVLMTTWNKGRGIIRERLKQGSVPIEAFLKTFDKDPKNRTEGTTSIYLSGEHGIVPPALLADFRHSRVLAEKVVLLSVVIESRPFVYEAERIKTGKLSHGFSTITCHYGFKEEIDIPKALGEHSQINVDHVDYVIGRETIVVTDKPGMAEWREKLYVFTYRNTTSASRYFGLPIEKTTESGQHIEL